MISRAEFHTLIDALCQQFEASITGGGRTRARNECVGGAKESRHLWEHGGCAADLACDQPSRHDELAWAARGVGLFALVESNHVHIDARWGFGG